MSFGSFGVLMNSNKIVMPVKFRLNSKEMKNLTTTTIMWKELIDLKKVFSSLFSIFL